ncbi:hypothetical protein [Haloferax sp. DFSO52]|uniref:hypothetical protein n=1 Tax=Haloferax sp. DFSO52 TaxID=3388505 RepID=UPI003A844E9C
MSGRAEGTAETVSTQNHRVLDAVRSHPWALSIAVGSLLVAFWAAVIQPRASPNGYVPIMVFYTILAVGFVYVDEFKSIRLTG